MELEKALKQLPVQKKARRLRILWPLIEAKLAEGVSHAAVLEFLNRSGFQLTEGTYKNYLHRFRKGQHPAVRTQPLSAPPVSSAEASTRPPTFDYDPRGISDLLK